MATTTTSSSTSNYVPPISIPGIGTSIDVNSLVTSLMKVESQPLTQLQTQQSSYQTQLSAVGSLKSALSTFQTALSSLTSASNYSAMKASGYDTSMLSASVTGSAPAGSYAVNVTQLAQSQVLAAQGQASTTTAIGSGASTTISFSFGSVSGARFPAASTPARRSRKTATWRVARSRSTRPTTRWRGSAMQSTRPTWVFRPAS